MQIVIDIPEKLYQMQISDDWIGNIYIRNAIVNGIPLPKGHGRLADIDKLIKATFYNPLHCPYITKEDIDDAKTVIPADKESAE